MVAYPHNLAEVARAAPAARQNWGACIWVACLWLPLLLLSLHFKLLRIAQRGIEWHGATLVELTVSDVSVVLAGACISFGVVVSVGGTRLRWPACAGLQLVGVLYACVLVAAHGYFMSTGTSLDFPMLAYSAANLRETIDVVGSANTPATFAAFSSALLAAVALPWWLAGQTGTTWTRLTRAWVSLGTWLVSALVILSALQAQPQQERDLAREALLNLVLSVGERNEPPDAEILRRAQQRPTGPQTLLATEHVTPKNVVVILLESTAAWATSLYGGPHATTPFLSELAEYSIVADRMHTVQPHTSKALVSVLCGIEPSPGVGAFEALPDGIPGRCLAELLRDNGYHTAYYQAARQTFENRPQLVRNMGFDAFTSGDMLDAQGFEKVNYFGYEDHILLEPVRAFLATQRPSKPFFLTILTNTPHHNYGVPKRYGAQPFSKKTVENRYLNAVRYDDFFLRELLESFKQAGAYENTVFVILGDHGEGLGQHGRFAHDDTIYQEGLHIPFLIHDPSGNRPARRLDTLHDQLDVTPTILDLLGYLPVDGVYVGSSVLDEHVARPLNATCYNDSKCVARFEGDLKLIHHFERQRDELFDLKADPDERTNLAPSRPDITERMRREVLDWYRMTRTMYRDVLAREAEPYVQSKPPAIEHARSIRFGEAVEYLGFSTPTPHARPGESITVTYHFRVLNRLPSGYQLFIHGWDGKRRHTWDHVPVKRLHPIDQWRPGQYVSDPHRIRVHKGWRSNMIVIRGGFWRPGTGRLPVTSGAADETASNDPVLAKIPVQRVRSAPTTGRPQP